MYKRQDVENPGRFAPTWAVTKGDDIVSVSEDGTITALAAGDATVEAKIPGLAARSGFLFIKALGQVGFYADGAINWDIAILVAGFGITLFISQLLSGMGMPANPQQATANKITPVMITGMFLFFPLPAGVLLYMLIANIFPRPANLHPHQRGIARQPAENSGSANGPENSDGLCHLRRLTPAL